MSHADGINGAWRLSPGPWWVKGYKAQNRGLSPASDHAKHAITAPLARHMRAFATPGAGVGDAELVVQYTVKHAQGDDATAQIGLSDMLKGTFCGGGYIKLLPGGVDAASFDGGSPYTLMFGPDICGYNEGKVHLIFGIPDGDGGIDQYHRREVMKLKASETSGSDDTYFNDLTHRYTLSLRLRSGRYRVYVDGHRLAHGSLGADYDGLTPDMVRDALADTARVGFELWMVRGGTVLDDVYVGGSLADANARAKRQAKYHKHKAERRASEKYWKKVQDGLNEKYPRDKYVPKEGDRVVHLDEQLGEDGMSATIRPFEDAEDVEAFVDDDDLDDDDDRDEL